MEMEAVANIFDKDGDGFIDYKEFVSALRPNRDPVSIPPSCHYVVKLYDLCVVCFIYYVLSYKLLKNVAGSVR